MRRFPRVSLLLLPFLVTSFLSGCGKKEPVVARVGSQSITQAEFVGEISSQGLGREGYLQTLPGRKELLELLIRRKILRAESDKAGVGKSEEVKKQLKAIDDALENQRQAARDRVVIGEYLRRLQDSELKVTDEAVRAYWEKESEARASHILVADLAAAQDVKARLAKGERFEKLAEKYSQDTGTARKGGDLGYLMPGSLVTQFEQPLFALKTGETSDIVQSPYGFHIIRKTGEQKISKKPFEDVKDILRSVISKRNFQAWIEKTRAHYKISIDAAVLEKLDSPAAPATPGGATGQP